VGGQGVAEQVSGASATASDPGSSKRSSNYVADRCWPFQADMRWVHALEHASTGARAAIFAEVSGQRLANISKQRQWLNYAALSADFNLSGPPVNVVEFEEDDLSSSEPESSEQK
jgi:hypothetical protein